jgi:hypothetical protein
LAGVAVAEWAGELVAAGLELVDGPAVVSDDVMVSAERGEIVFAGGSVLCPGLVVVEVAVEGGDATAGEDTDRCLGLHLSFQPGAGSASGDPVADTCPVLVSNRVPPFGLELFVDYLAGDVGDDRPPPRYLTRLIV